MAGALGFLAAALLFPAVGGLLNMVPVDPAVLAVVLAFTFLCMAGFELVKVGRAIRSPPSPERTGT
jgi:hypothetical protein